MSKETYYFSHDYNARNDKKISALVRDFKSSGYGIFWAACEMMHEEGGALEFDDLTIDAIAKDINEESDLVKTILEKCVDKYKLFTKQDILLQSSRVCRNLETKNDKKIVKAEAGRIGGIRSGESRRSAKLAEAEQSTTSSNEPKERKVKESKVKESKVKEKEEPHINKFWFLRFYRSDYSSYKSVFNGQSSSEEDFNLWKKFIDHIYTKHYEELFECKFLNPKDFGILLRDKNFTTDKWDDTLKKILATGIKPEHNLFFRIPEFMTYINNKKDATGNNQGGKSASGTSKDRVDAAKKW